MDVSANSCDLLSVLLMYEPIYYDLPLPSISRVGKKSKASVRITPKIYLKRPLDTFQHLPLEGMRNLREGRAGCE